MIRFMLLWFLISPPVMQKMECRKKEGRECIKAA